MEATIRIVHFTPDPFLGERYAIGAILNGQFWPCIRWKAFEHFGDKARWHINGCLVSLETKPDQVDHIAPSITATEPMKVDVPDPLEYVRALFWLDRSD